MKVKDPVCGMRIEDKEAAGTSAYQDKTYYFCSASCKEKFDRNPGAYTKAAGEEKKAS